ncbi:gamma-glutamyltransferase [candidate division KSB1 bacterium]
MFIEKRSRVSAILVSAAFIFTQIIFCSSAPIPPGAFKNGIVVSTHEIASQVGVDILKQGGNAVDAAVAVSYALAVVYPRAGNIGGGGFMVIRTADGHETTIDYREKAPGRAHRDMYLDENGNVIRNLNRNGALASGVPGTVAGTLYALEKYGKSDRKTVLEPAIDLAENGFVLTDTIGGAWSTMYAPTAAIFNKPDGSPHLPGERLIQQDLAKTLKAISDQGHDGFYMGSVAECIVHTMEKYEGIISHDDLANYRPAERKPVTGTYRGYGIVSMQPPSSGGTTLLLLLNMLERYEIGELGWNTPETAHLMAETERRAFSDRNNYIADPDFVSVPVSQLISKAYADIRVQDIDPDRATSSMTIRHGDVSDFISENEETTHISVVDKDGMAVSLTTTIERSYGSYLVVEGAGFLLNNEMGDFSAKTGVPNAAGLVYGDANGIEANKRMLSSMTPTIITKEGKNYMVIGSPGGPTIITTVLQCIMNVIDHGMTIDRAVNAGRFHHQWLPDRIDYETKYATFTEATINALKQRGHIFRSRIIGNAQGIIIDPETGYLFGGPDPRRFPPSSAKGY